jgi:8-oxo-dGTP diphosphatase
LKDGNGVRKTKHEPHTLSQLTVTRKVRDGFMTTQSKYTYDFPRPRVSCDMVVFAQVHGERHVLLIRRGNEPFKGDWALPGGFVEEGETLDACAHRELLEETGVSGVRLRQLGTWGDPGRDPRGWSISVAYWGEVEGVLPEARGGDDAAHAEWKPVDRLPTLAFDHADMVAQALRLAS